MPRVAREKSATGIYHIIMRGINRQTVFVESEDSVRFVETLERYNSICEYELYAYCLMGNHVHLLLKEGKEPLETVMRRICGSYVLWYNKKYSRIGNLFQDRFKSEPVEDDRYFLTVLRYIFQNPVKAGLLTRVEDYPWNNYGEYVRRLNKPALRFVLGLFNLDQDMALRSFSEFVNQKNEDKCLDITETKQLRDADAVKIIQDYCTVDAPSALQGFEAARRDSCLRALKQIYGLSIRQIERLTGINRGIIQRA